MHSRSVKSFTLIELLVVVAIVAVLVSILLPALSVAREKGRQVSCLSNLKQIGVMLFLYADDHSGWSIMAQPEPRFSGDWEFGGYHETLENLKYLTNRGTFFCPSAKDVGFRTSNVSYGINYWTFGYNPSPDISPNRPVKLAEALSFGNGSSLIYVGDALRSWVNGNSALAVSIRQGPPYPYAPYGSYGPTEARHLDNVNCLMAEGCAMSLDPAEIVNYFHWNPTQDGNPAGSGSLWWRP
ncbi:MAG: DUF1559 domain-containing protein [Phycisphaerae bacterium]|nr:DUF1559 domain-containing protein [Phycisphaerae bacterium]